MQDWKNLIRVGVVSSVNHAEGTVRVFLPDQNDQVTGDLSVLVPQTTHARYASWPTVGETVACIFLGNGLQAGFVLGAMYTEDNPPPGANPGVWFSDGSYVYFEEGTLRVQAASAVHITAPAGVRIEGDLHVTGTLTGGVG